MLDRARALPGGGSFDAGWEALVELLRRAEDSPVVSSFSVTADFPAGRLIDEVRDEAWWDAWDEAPYEERWDRSMEVLRAESASSPSLSREMRPDHWRSYRFSPGEISGFNLHTYVSGPPAAAPRGSTRG